MIWQSALGLFCMADKKLWRHHYQEPIDPKFSGLIILVDDPKEAYSKLSCFQEGNC